MPLDTFHPAVARWFERAFDAPTQAQSEAWPAIQSGEHTLLAAPTGAGKTLAAFLATIDELMREGLRRQLPDETRVLYISPLKALSNDIQKNLQQPLMGIRDELLEAGCPDVDVRAAVRTGDTPQSERARMARRPPHILVTTPESAYILLTSDSGRRMLGTVRTVIVDEIHALAGSKRGSHLALSLERLEALCGRPVTRVGLSATQKPIERIARFLVGNRDAGCRIIDTGHQRDRDLALELPLSPLETIMSNEVWQEVYDRLETLVGEHRTTLIFVNTRRLAERAARFLAERLGEDAVTSHHGSLAKEHRLDAEQRLKAGKLKALIATASLELGIDIGDIDLVCQLGSPRGIAAFLQRVGRSGHAVGQTPKGRLFPLSRDDLVECTALIGAAHSGELDRVIIPEKPLDVLAQQIVAELGAGEWDENALFDTVLRAWPYRDLGRDDFDAIVGMLAQGFSTRRGRRGAFVHHDAVNGVLKPRRGARLTAVTNGGAIPDQFDYDVVLSPEAVRIGSLNEDFAFESMPGDVFQLGNTSYRVLKVQTGKVYVEDAHGAPPTIPFWFGEAPGRSDELSQAVSQLRADMDTQLDEGGAPQAERWLVEHFDIPLSASTQLTTYLATARAALGLLPVQDHIIFERFFDEAGDMHLVLHTPFGSRINRAWGLSLRKRFCRQFNFELQAAATEDSIILSLGATHSFALDEVRKFLSSRTVRDVLVQALLDVPMFGTRWRWNATIALAVRRFRNGKKVPPQFQRSDAEDLVAVVFPDQLACLENIAGKREIPDHPLVRQSIHDCLTETMDIDGLEALLGKLEAGDIEVACRDLNGPSPLSQEILNARPYAFLDDAPAEERRTLAVQSRRYNDPADAAELGRLDGAAIATVRKQAWPDARNADELHDGLVVLGFITEAEGTTGSLSDSPGANGFGFGWRHLYDELVDQRRATCLTLPAGQRMWVAAERLAEMALVLPHGRLEPVIDAVGATTPTDRDAALVDIVRSRLEGLGPVTADTLSQPLGLTAGALEPTLLALENEGFAIRGHFTAPAGPLEWCDRRLLARIHRNTVKRLRSEIEPVSEADYQRFLLRWHGLDMEAPPGDAQLMDVIGRMEGWCASAGAWEQDLLAARVGLYAPQLLDNACTSGRLLWLKISVTQSPTGQHRAGPVRQTPVALIRRGNLANWRPWISRPEPKDITLSKNATVIRDALGDIGASFFSDVVDHTGQTYDAVAAGLAELVAWGMATSDTFAGLRALIAPAPRSGRRARRGQRQTGATDIDAAGRWSLLKAPADTSEQNQDNRPSLEHVAWTLLRRYGVVFRRVLERETGLPPWRDLLRTYWRLEARGEIRGGRFVQRFSGEQFALPDAVGALRQTRKRKATGKLVAISATDPLNLVGIIVPGERVPAVTTNRILFRDGVPAAVQIAGQCHILGESAPEAEWEARVALTATASRPRGVSA